MRENCNPGQLFHLEGGLNPSCSQETFTCNAESDRGGNHYFHKFYTISFQIN